jgi:hypothetical protein
MAEKYYTPDDMRTCAGDQSHIIYAFVQNFILFY